MNWRDELQDPELHPERKEAILRSTKEMMERFNIYTFQDGHVVASTKDYTLIEKTREFYPLSALPYMLGETQHWEVRGWPMELNDLGREIAHRQSIAKGYAGIRGYTPNEEADCSTTRTSTA